MHIEPGVVAIIGAGGKSTLLRALAEELCARGSVIVATSTKMHVPEWCCVVLDEASDEGSVPGEGSMSGDAALQADAALSADAAPPAAKEAACAPRPNPAALLGEIQAALSENSVVCVGSIHGPTGKLQAPNLDFSDLANLADYVLVEADGSKGLPLKAHEAHEPVIPSCTARTVCVTGIDGVGSPISQACHRPKRFAQLADSSEDSITTPEMVARVLNAERFCDIVLVNKVHTNQDWQAAQCLAALLNTPVVAGSLQEGRFQCLR